MSSPTEHAWLEALAAIDDTVERERMAANFVLPPDAPAHVHLAVLSALYSDLPRASRLAEVGKAVAAVRGDSPSQAYAAKCDAHVAYIRGDHEAALAAYQEALRLFDESGDDLESARTLSSGLQTLILLGQYDQAHSWASRAEKIFLKHGDALRLARLDSNVGNILFRQDRPRDAIVHYERALDGFKNLGDGKDIAAVLSNLAVCHTSLAHFAEAFSYYQSAREACVGNGLMALAAQADYNIAYLHYLRGDYRVAREIYQRCRLDGDAYHSALCDLDEAELLLELNLTHEGEVLAERAERGFAALGMRYEQAKALVNRAVAASQRRDHELADQNLRKARRLFVRENNDTWRAMTDLLRAVLAFHANRHRSARALSSAAWRILEETPVASRAAHCQILLARLWLRSGHADRARAIGHAVIECVGEDVSPSLRFHASLLEGEVNEMQGRSREAMEAYEAARREIEDLRGRVDTEDLRISILTDKLAVYDALVSMCLDSPASAAAAERALLLVQQAKSRGLADRLSGTFETADPGEPYASLRKELNWCYRRIQTIGLERESGRFRDRARELESQLVALRAPVRGPDLEPVASVAAVRASLPEGALLLEYFEARGVLYVFLVQRSGLEAVRLGPSAPARQLMKLLLFQLGKSRIGTSRLGIDAANHHLGELYAILLGPVESHLAGFRHLIIAPHRNLHGLPFAALRKGGESLIDRFTISTIPSASVFAGCRSRSGKPGTQSAVFAVPDARAPLIAEEAAVVADLLTPSRVIYGRDATLDAFRRHASGLRVLHLSTHGIFRTDNPLFSSIQLADGQLNLLDLQHAVVDTELVTLSSCSSGSTVSVGGDERLGLIRGFLAAGARNLLVSLWDIDDASTMEFMRSFYANFHGLSLPHALRQAMLDVREKYPHPYHWSPFILVGGST